MYILRDILHNSYQYNNGNVKKTLEVKMNYQQSNDNMGNRRHVEEYDTEAIWKNPS